MLARKLSIRLENGQEVGTTPMLVPSISSRTNIDPTKIIKMISETYTGPLLISAYDMKHAENFPQVSFPSLIFIDSGGYECAKDYEISEIGLYRPDSKEWNKDLYSEIIDGSETYAPPKVVVSYDHPSERISIEEQIKGARELFRKKEGIIKELLIKPEPSKPNEINVEQVEQYVNKFTPFDIIGFTEKELGRSVLERMSAIAKIRKVMDRNQLNIPIHIFGSLDPITTPLYYISGAAIFDGLSWLRFIFSRCDSLYIDSFGPYHIDIEASMKQIFERSIAENLGYIRRLNMNLRKFQANKDYKYLGLGQDEYENFFRNSYEDLKVKIGGDD